MNNVHAQLQDVFYKTEPQLSLLNFSEPPGGGYGVASFQLSDAQGYDVGLMRCVGARFLCMTTMGVEYGWVDFYTKDTLPGFLSPLAEGMSTEELILVFSLADEDHAEHSLLPVGEGKRFAYIVCESVEYQGWTGRPA